MSLFGGVVPVSFDLPDKRHPMTMIATGKQTKENIKERRRMIVMALFMVGSSTVFCEFG
jgi:hypothetical protein